MQAQAARVSAAATPRHHLQARTIERPPRRLGKSLIFWIAVGATAIGVPIVIAQLVGDPDRGTARDFGSEAVHSNAPTAASGVAPPNPQTAAPSSAPSTLGIGSIGPEVTALQERLRGLGFDPGAIDGKFGAATAIAARAFQNSLGISADGVVGPETWAALDQHS